MINVISVTEEVKRELAMSDAQAVVEAETGRCAGSGLCHHVAPEFFDVAGGVVRVLRRDVSEAELDTVEEAVESCPMQALSLGQPTK